jgi:uncharacterized protein (TIGR02266 family)
MAHRELSPKPDTTHRLSVLRPEAQIRLLFEKFQAFVDEYRPKISLGGVFIATAQPKPVGTTISCEFRLADGFRLCQARGDVLWVRPQATAPDRPAGMGIRFCAIDDEGRKLILKILEEQVKTGGEPFEVERLPGDAETAAGERTPEPREDPESTHRRSASTPMPREDPASTLTRKAVTSVQPVDASGGGEAFAAVKPLDDFIVEPVGSEEPADFNAPWGVALPGIPEEVIEPADEEAVMTSIDEDFASDPKEAAFPAAEDADLFELETPGADAAGLDELPDFEVIEEESADDSPPLLEWLPPAPKTVPERPDELFASTDFPDLDEPLDPGALGPGPRLAGLDDTLHRSLSDDAPQLAKAMPPVAAVPPPDPPGGAAAPAALSASAVGAPASTLGALPDLDEPLTPADAGFGFPEGSAASDPGLGGLTAAPDDDLAAGPISDFGLGPVERPAFSSEDSDASWWSSDADDEWEEEAAESRIKGFARDLQLTVAESKGRILAVVGLLVLVAAGVVFREQVLGLVGLGSEGVPGPARPAPSVARTEPEESLPAGAAGAGRPVDESGPDGGVSGSPAGTDGLTEAVPSSEGPATTAAAETVPAVTSPVRELAVPPSPAPRPSAAGSAEATSVRNIECEQTPQGTKCVVAFDGELAPNRYEHHPLGYDPLKEQIVILGIETPYEVQRIDVGTLELDRIRTGHDHGRLRLVFDLSSERMTLSSFEPRAGRLEVIVSRRH